jgi:hypothetical protein
MIEAPSTVKEVKTGERGGLGKRGLGRRSGRRMETFQE